MKWSILILVLMIVTYSSMVYGQEECPPNWSFASLEFENSQSGCRFRVEFCYNCQIVVGNPNSTLRVIEIKPLNGCLAADRNWIISELWKIYFDFCTVEPCSVSCLTTRIEYPLCFQWHTYGSIINEEYSYYSWLQPCPGSGYCQVTRKLCLEEGLIISCPSDPLVTYQTFDLNCQTEIIEEPTEFNPDFEGERITSECFKYETCP